MSERTIKDIILELEGSGKRGFKAAESSPEMQAFAEIAGKLQASKMISADNSYASMPPAKSGELLIT